MGSGVIVSMAWFGGLCSLTGAEAVDLQDRAVRLRDVVELDCAPADARETIGSLVIGALRAGSSQVALQHADIADLVRRRAPGLALEPAGDPERVVLLRAGEIPIDAARDTACFALSRGVQAGAALSADDLVPVSCANHPSRALYYEATHGVVRAASDLAEGSYVGRLLVSEHAFPDAGDRLVLSVSVGPVQIDRQVEAVQPGPDGGKIFVRDEAGSVFPVPLVSDAKGSRQ
jgi:hypothetical protein